MFRRSTSADLEPVRRALAQGRYEAAFALLEDAARRPRSRVAQALLRLQLAAVYALYGVDGLENGALTLRSAVETDPGITQHPLYQALYWEFAAARGEPIGEVKRGVKAVVAGDDPVAGYHAASALFAAGAFKSAVKALEALDPMVLPAYLRWRRCSLLGQAHEHLGNFEEAATAFQQAVLLSTGPERDIERLSLAGCLLELGRADEVLGVLDAIDVASLGEDEDLRVLSYLRGRAQLELGNPNQALSHLLEALAVGATGPDPSDAGPDSDAAEEAVGAAASASRYSLQFTLGQTYAALGRFDESAAAFEAAVAVAPPEYRPFARHECALSYLDAGRLEDAEQMLGDVLSDPSYPHRAEAFADLAEVLMRLGHSERAEEVALDALELGATASACLCLGNLAFDAFRLDEAVAWFEKAVSASAPGEPHWVQAQQLLADIFSQRGPAEAERLLHHARAALAFTPPHDDWYLPLQRYLEQAREQLGGASRMLN